MEIRMVVFVTKDARFEDGWRIQTALVMGDEDAAMRCVNKMLEEGVGIVVGWKITDPLPVMLKA